MKAINGLPRPIAGERAPDGFPAISLTHSRGTLDLHVYSKEGKVIGSVTSGGTTSLGRMPDNHPASSPAWQAIWLNGVDLLGRSRTGVSPKIPVEK